MRGMTRCISRWSSGDGGSLIRPRVAPIEEALGASRFGAPHLVGNAARILADRWPARCAAAVQGRSASRRPTSPGWHGSAPRSVRRPRRPGPYYLRAPDAKPSKGSAARKPSAARPRHDGTGSPNCGAAAPRWSNPRRLRDAPRLAQLHGASFHRGWGEGEFEAMLTERNTLVHRLRIGRKIIGFAVSRMAADEAEILSIAVAAEPSRPRPVPQSAADPSRPSRRPRRAHRIPRGRGK